MTRSERDNLDKIERDRRRRELALLLLALLPLIDQARRFINHGLADSGTLLEPRMDRLPGVLARGMADAHVAGVRRAGAMAGVELVPRAVTITDTPIYAAALDLYRPSAHAAAADLRAAILATATAAVSGAQGVGRRGLVEAINSAFVRYGFSRQSPSTIDSAAQGKPGFGAMRHATDAVLSAYSGGLHAGYHTPPVRERLKAFRHRSIIDNRTSQWCDMESRREGLTLPVEHPYWLLNWCPLHRACRSVVLGIFEAVEFSESLPTIWPQPGFGIAPSHPFGVPLLAA